jgi:hypothetical protein
MNRVRRGFKLAGVSWRVLVAEPAILAVLAVGLIATVVLSGGLFLLLFRRFPSGEDFEFPNYLVALPVLWLGSIASTYCNVVVTVMADHRLRGDDPTVNDGIKVATEKLNRIVSWTLISIAVGLLLQVIAERFRLAGYITSRLLGVAWGLATTFVLPVIALEDDVSVGGSIRRSASIFRAKWGESVVAQASVSLAIFLCAIPAFFVVALLMAMSAPVGIAGAVIAIGAVVLISGALDSVVSVALYRYAMDGTVLGAFTSEDLDDVFKPKDT